jgi:ABC-2 type transport system permease protein
MGSAREKEREAMILRTLTVARKELLHIVRDKRTLVIVFVIPIFQLFALGYAFTTDFQHLRIAVLDADRTPQSRALLEAYRVSTYFDIAAYVSSEAELGGLVDRGEVYAGIVIPASYGADVTAGRVADVAFIIDGSDPTVANTVLSASQQIGQAESMRLIEQRTGRSLTGIAALRVSPRVWYNPEMRNSNFMVPGVIAMILSMITMLLTSMAIVREREQGTLEQLIVTPIRPIELVVGKVLPYVLLAFFDVLEVLVIGVFWFGVPVHGSLFLLLALSALFLVTSLGLGIFFSSLASTQQEAMMLTFLVMLPSIFLAGFLFPIEAMPRALQWFSYVVPLRYMLVIVRGIMLKGVGLGVLSDQVIALVIFGVVIMVVAATRFRKRLE